MQCTIMLVIGASSGLWCSCSDALRSLFLGRFLPKLNGTFGCRFFIGVAGSLTYLLVNRAMEQILRLFSAGRYGEAVHAARARMAALQLGTAGGGVDPDLRAVYGLALGGTGDLQGALIELHEVALLRPDEPHPCLDLLPVLRAAGRDRDIEPFLLAILAVAPRTPLVALALARQYRENGKIREALALARHAVVLGPEFAEAQRLIAWILADLGDLEGSVLHSRRAVALDPLDAAAWSNLGVALTDLGRHQEGEHAHQRALDLAGHEPRVRVNRAVNLLAQGRMAEAWADYEWRLRLPGHTALPIDLLLPDLASGVSLLGKTILITHEDGLGDTIQFARFAPLLVQMGARVLAHAPPALERLFQTLDRRIRILPSTAPIPAFDYHCPYTSLPRAFGVGLSTIPAAPYLFADPALIAGWQTRLRQTGQRAGAREGRRIGLVWAGQTRPWLEGYGALDGRRSMRLADLAPLATLPGISWVCLQKVPAVQDLAAGLEVAQEMENFSQKAGANFCNPMPEVRDFADTAAIMAGLDAVISVDTSVAHLAAAMGTRVYLLDRFDTCWRWLRGRTDNPWYPTITICRQEKIGDWTRPVGLLSQILQDSADLSAASGADVPRSRASPRFWRAI